MDKKYISEHDLLIRRGYDPKIFCFVGKIPGATFSSYIITRESRYNFRKVLEILADEAYLLKETMKKKPKRPKC